MLLFSRQAFPSSPSPGPIVKTTPQQGGGVLTLVRNHIPAHVREDLSNVDLLSLQVENNLIINAYVPPETSPWEHWADVEPIQRLEEVLAVASASALPIILMGDLNARTASLQSMPDAPLRTSQDPQVYRRGRELLQVLAMSDLLVLNGTGPPHTNSGCFTSFQSQGSSVIDYGIISLSLLRSARPQFAVLPHDSLSDHAALSLILTLQLPSLVPAQAETAPIRLRDFLPTPCTPVSHNSLDSLVSHALDSARTPDEMVAHLYGPAFFETPPLTVYTDGSAHDNGTPRARAGAATFWGPNSAKNWHARVPGTQTNNRAELFAVLHAIRQAPTDRSLRIFSDSQYAIRSIRYWAPATCAARLGLC